ncbi:hypothetical protein [Mucilaginibacter sp. UR6-11]|uniref:hypothetical protein n=1 Tax=Mucilaginibacter sp. UR6-11 TaxID=1435644 RepID=UPI001E2A3A46|nr:hypothetical protein [Mucilaginibacter sp. UR6-11]MCC8423532.1 hypothetical protein [Mucilaginibacter sp. UR6-11]
MKRVLFITGSMHQTLQMHLIAQELSELDCWFSQVFTDSRIINFIIKYTTLADGTALAGQFRDNSERYMQLHNLQIDYGARINKYDLVVYCSDLLIPPRMRRGKTIWVQEGMVDKATVISKLVQALKLPPALCANTSLNGSTNICDFYCVASPGYKQHFEKMGTNASKLIVTGIPNYDNVKQFLKNDFPFRDYVMVATTDMRETFRFENRPAFIKQAVKIAAGRSLLFKLHPNEKFDRAEKEIRKYAPKGSMIFRSGNTNHMIANCAELITQYSTVVFTGIALGKKVHSWFNINELIKLTPIQNGGISAQNIAALCRSYVAHDETHGKFNPAGITKQQQTESELLEELLIN